MSSWCRILAGNRRFQEFVLGTIVFNAVVMGLATFEGLRALYGPFFAGASAAVQGVFILEMMIRILAWWPRPGRFFRDGWNVFDFSIVAASLIPEIGLLATVGRLARLLRVARVLSAFPDLRLIVGTMLRSLPSMGHILALLGVLMYVYAILGHSLFAAHNPRHWGSLTAALGTLFQIMTLEGWVEIQAASMAVYPWAWLFYASFIVIAVFVVINLFIAVVINNLEAVRKEEAAGRQSLMQGNAAARLREIQKELSELERALGKGDGASGAAVPVS
jgi:voltage-gated sodium channel